MNKFIEKKKKELDEILYQESVYGNPNYHPLGWIKAKDFLEQALKEVYEEGKKKERIAIKKALFSKFDKVESACKYENENEDWTPNYKGIVELYFEDNKEWDYEEELITE